MKTKRNFTWILATSAFGLGLVVSLSTCFGVYVGMNLSNENLASQNDTGLENALRLHAGTASKGKSLSMATGLIDGNVEGLFVLDHISGNLQCWILNSKTGAVGGVYVANPGIDLAADKAGEPDYIMTTGNFFWSGRNTGNSVPAQSVVYVADGTSGNVVGYSLAYDKQAIIRGIVQQGVLKPVCKGTARDSVTRDQ